MTEILTESFCERCGTRYTFESAAPRQRRMGGLKVLGRGLKNFVMSDDSSLDEALAAARSDVERDATSQQLDAFHRTFNFCMSCRQYTCANCWNSVEAHCLSCAPLTIAETAPVFEDVDPDRLRRLIGPGTADASAANAALAAHVHLPEMVGAEDGAAEEAIADQAHEPIPAVAPPIETLEPARTLAAPAFDAPPPAEPAFAAPAEPALASPSLAEPALAVPAETSTATIGGLVPGQTIDDAIAAYEAAQPADTALPAAEAATPAPSPIESAPAVAAIGDATVEAVDDHAALVERPAVEAEVRAALPAAPTDDAVAAAAPAKAAPIEAPGPEVPDVRAPGVDVIAQPVWPAATPASPATPPAGPGSTGAPAWPTGPRWPTSIPAGDPIPPQPGGSGPDPLAALMSRNTTDAMWAASSRDVLQPVAAVQATAAVQPCVNCGISLSATARFCRRCGTAQG